MAPSNWEKFGGEDKHTSRSFQLFNPISAVWKREHSRPVVEQFYEWPMSILVEILLLKRTISLRSAIELRIRFFHNPILSL